MRTPESDRSVRYLVLIGLDGKYQTGGWFGQPPLRLRHPPEIGYNGQPHTYKQVGLESDDRGYVYWIFQEVKDE